MALGQLRIPLNKRQYFVVTGGPFFDCPKTMVGVKMAKEIRQACAVDIPTVDFAVPDKALLTRGLDKALNLMLDGEPLYVGCMGGKGRTGLFMAVLAKAFGIKNPVEYVRKHYYAHAVETPEQYKFVQAFPITPEVERKVKQAKRWAWVRFWKTNLTDAAV
jgi:protein tyrosine phosphatase